MESETQSAERSSEADESWIDEDKEGREEQNDDEPTTATDEKDLKQSDGTSAFNTHSKMERTIFVNGLSVGLGIGCIATFVMMWIAIFFSPQLPAGATYESILPIFIYSLIYLLAVGLIALTAGIVRQYYMTKIRN